MRVKSSYIVAVAALIVVALSGCCTGTTATIATIWGWGSEHDFASVCISGASVTGSYWTYTARELKAEGPDYARLLASYADSAIIRVVPIRDPSSSCIVFDGPPYLLPGVGGAGTIGGTYVYEEYLAGWIVLVTSYQPTGGLFSTPMPASEAGPMINT